MALAGQRDELLRRLAQEATGWPQPPVFGSLFGSGARGDHTASSDLDLLLVRSDSADEDAWDEACDRLADRAVAWTRNDARIVSVAEAQVRESGGNVEFYESVSRDGLVFVGDPGWLRHRLLEARHSAGYFSRAGLSAAATAAAYAR